MFMQERPAPHHRRRRRRTTITSVTKVRIRTCVISTVRMRLACMSLISTNCVTRRSIIGALPQVKYLVGANASFLLPEVYVCLWPFAGPSIPQQPWSNPSFSSSSPSPFYRGPGIYPREIFFGIKDARRWRLEHFGYKNQHLYEPDFSD